MRLLEAGEDGGCDDTSLLPVPLEVYAIGGIWLLAVINAVRLLI